MNTPSRSYVKLREGISLSQIENFKELVFYLNEYEYPKILNNVKDDKLLYSIFLTTFSENIGISYLKLLSEDPYYRNDIFYIRDFILYSTRILHYVNVIYKMGLDDKKIMNVCKVFATKNLKLLCIYKYAWELSYNSIHKEINSLRRGSYFNAKLKITTNSNTSEKRWNNLDEFDSEINFLFDFIFKID